MTKEDKQIIDRAVKENWRIGNRTRLKHLLKKNLELYRENVELQIQKSRMFNTIVLQEQQIEKMKCCENCKHKKSEVDRCELLMYTMNACLCKNKDKWELKE